MELFKHLVISERTGLNICNANAIYMKLKNSVWLSWISEQLAQATHLILLFRVPGESMQKWVKNADPQTSMEVLHGATS